MSQATVVPTVNDSGATYVVKLGGVTDADGIVIALSVGSNVVTVVVTAEDGSTTQTYTVTVTREGLPIEETEAETEQRLRVQYDANENGAIDRDEVLTAINDYLFDGLLAKDEVLVVINHVSLRLTSLRACESSNLNAPTTVGAARNPPNVSGGCQIWSSPRKLDQAECEHCGSVSGLIITPLK